MVLVISGKTHRKSLNMSPHIVYSAENMTSQDILETLVAPLFSDFVEDKEGHKLLLEWFERRFGLKFPMFHRMGVIHVKREDMKIWVTLNTDTISYGDYVTIVYVRGYEKVTVTIRDNIRDAFISGEIKKVMRKLKKEAEKSYDPYIIGRNEMLIIILKVLLRAMKKAQE